MKESYEEFRNLARVEHDVQISDLPDFALKQLFMVAYLAGQKEAVLNPIL